MRKTRTLRVAGAPALKTYRRDGVENVVGIITTKTALEGLVFVGQYIWV
jgi:hypothetical protein